MKTHHGNEEWEAVMEMAKEDARRVPLPPDLFEVWKFLEYLSDNRVQSCNSACDKTHHWT
jgi:hypothetical protein